MTRREFRERLMLACAVEARDIRHLWLRWPLIGHEEFEETFAALVEAGAIEGEIRGWRFSWHRALSWPRGWFRVPRWLELQAAGATWGEEPRP